MNNIYRNRQLLLCLSKHLNCIQTKTKSTSKTLDLNENKCNNCSEESINNKTKYENQNKDYLGISEANKREMSGLYANYDPNNEVFDKYNQLLGKRSAKMNEQNILITSFGKVRLDSDNEPGIHGQYDPESDRLLFDFKEFEQKFNTNRETEPQNTSESDSKVSDEQNIFEEQYFDNCATHPEVADNSNDKNPINTNERGFGFIDRQYFVNNPNTEPLFKRKIDFKFKEEFINLSKERGIEQKIAENINIRRGYRNQRKEMPKTTTESKLLDNSFDSKTLALNSPLKSELFSQNFETNIEMNTKSDEEIDENDIQKKIDEQMEIKLEDMSKPAQNYSQIPRTGAQYLEDIRNGKQSPEYQKKFTQEVKDFGSNLKGEKLDSKGFRILRGQVLDYTMFTHEDIVELLFDSILFNDADIVAINKPYGMEMHSNDSNTGPVLTNYLEDLNERIGCQKLYTVHRLDKDTTGILLMAKTQEKAKDLNKMFCEHNITKRYICITRGVPDEPEGIIDIPIDLGHCNGKERMVLRPEALEEYKTELRRSSKNAKRAVTQYKVLSQSENAALIEVWPQTGVKHQIRVHLGFGLRCPVLGDHKYSHLDRIAPQKLTGDMLLALNVRQSKVRHIPMHLHAKQYCLPGAGTEGRNIFINAPIPHHFHQNMSRLRLREN